METIKIEFIKISDKNKAGEPYIIKNGKSAGKPFKRVAIKPEGNPNWISNNIFRNDDPTLNWKVGDTVEVIIEQNGEWTNFRVPTQEDRIQSENAFLKQKLARLENANIGVNKEQAGSSQNFPPVIGANQGIKEDLMSIEADQVPF